MTTTTPTQMMTNQTTESDTSQVDYSSDSELFKKPDIAELNSYYNDGDSCDSEVFSEMRSGVLLVAGEHYQKKSSSFYKRIRDSRDLSQEQKLRLTKNHTRKICQLYANNIISTNPGVGFSPKDERSMHDQKVAEMHHAVWADAKERYNIDDKIDDWVDSFVQIGEVAVKIFFDDSLGDISGYEPLVSDGGEPVLNEMGAMTPDTDRPVFTGEFVFEEIYGFNLLRPAECKDLRKAEWLCLRKMTSRSELLRKFKANQEVCQKIQASQDETYQIFDATKGGYRKTTSQTLIREFYFRPSLLFPQGYFYITTKEGILAEGELPGGLFPIVVAPFDKVQTTPRGRSPIKTMRPYQAEINRTASKIAEHQITLGDDKLLIQNGTKLSSAASLPGIRGVNYTGAAPTILQGRDGSQYAGHMTSQITEMYQVMMVQEDSTLAPGAMDPYTLLFRSASQKKSFQRYTKRFEKFLVEVVKLYLALAKVHLPDDAVITAVGKNDQINIPEFRQYPATVFDVKVEAQSDDVETKLGKQMVLNHIMQFVGPTMKSEDLGKIIRQMPYANADESFDDLTLKYDTVKNGILSLDRGEQPPVGQYDDHKYWIEKLVSRAQKPDFQFLSPQIQNNYNMKIQTHQQMESANIAAIQRAEAGFIPTSGYLVTCQLYVKDPADPTGVKTRLARVPYDSLAWLIKQLEVQGTSMNELQNLPSGAQAQMGNMIVQQGGGAPQGAQPTPGVPSMGAKPPMMSPPGHGAGHPMAPGAGPHPMASAPMKQNPWH